MKLVSFPVRPNLYRYILPQRSPLLLLYFRSGCWGQILVQVSLVCPWKYDKALRVVPCVLWWCHLTTFAARVPATFAGKLKHLHCGEKLIHCFHSALAKSPLSRASSGSWVFSSNKYCPVPTEQMTYLLFEWVIRSATMNVHPRRCWIETGSIELQQLHFS